MDTQKADKIASTLLKPLVNRGLSYRDLTVSAPSKLYNLHIKLPKLDLENKVHAWCKTNNVDFNDVWMVSARKVYYYGRFLMAQEFGNQPRPQPTVVQPVVQPIVLEQIDWDEEVKDLIPVADAQYVNRTIHEHKDIELMYRAFINQMPVLITGSCGTGKTALFRNFCAQYQIPYFRVNLNGGTTVEDLAGQWVPSNGSFVWSDGVLTKMMLHGGCLVFDEINACPPEIAFVLHSVLDDERKLVLVQKDGEIVKAHKRFFICATMNPETYAGVRELNEALRDRFLIQLQFETDDVVEKRIIKNKGVVVLAQLLRSSGKSGETVEISTRQLLALERNIELFGVGLALESFCNRMRNSVTGEVARVLSELTLNLQNKTLDEILTDLKKKL